MLAMMEYGTLKYASSTMSSETLSESCGSRNNRIRTVRLVRPSHGPPPGLSYRHGPSLGFSIRGGREHGTGIFVSHVEVGSEAHTAGLRVGDQIIRINGFAIDDAVHKEVLQLISNHSHLILKVRGVGMIPVKNKISDGLSWQIITASTDSPLIRESPQLNDKNDVRINILVAPKSKLSCGICKGPDWKPGIFVQFTKEGGIAREAGLRPGDQILHCNQVDFSDINFNEAVSLMKSSKQLQLTVRKGAGSELFPGESSGYNSSASSVTGDQSPSWADSKRLSIVKEELTQLDQFKKNFKKWDSWDEDSEDKPLFKPTIINLTESGTTIHNNGSQYSFNEEPLYTVPHKTHQKTTAEVHHNSEKNGHLTLTKSASASSFGSVASCSNSVASNLTTISLSSAITMEIQRRQKKILTEKASIDEQLTNRKIAKKTGPPEKQWQHTQLMGEFKKAHRRMFKKCDEDEINENSSSCQDRINNNNELTQKLSKRLSEIQQSSSDCTNGATPPPPPPPPQLTFKPLTSTLKKPPTVPVKYSVLSSPPPCPTPDYDTLSLASSTSSHTPISKRILSKSQSETSTIRRGSLQKPVTVTIGEYPSMRREVGKLDFLQSTNKTSGGAINDRLTNELTQTLNRSNLKKRTESMENLIEQQRNGTVRINLNKSTNDLTNDYVTINVNKNKSITFADDNN